MNGYNLLKRSANRGNSNNVWNVNSTGNVNNNNARNSNRSAPDCKLIENMTFGHRSDVLGEILQGDCIPAERQNTALVMPSPHNEVDGYVHLGQTFNEVESVVGFDALYRSLIKCQQGVMFKSSAAYYSLNFLEEILKQERELMDGTYKQRQSYMFVKTKPKRREFLSISFRDRVYQRSLNDVIVYPALTKSLIYENMACQKKKGTDAARQLLKEHLRRMFRKHGTDFHVLQCDIKGYYPNLQHTVVKDKFKEKLPEHWYARTETILNHQYTGDVGFNAGSQMVQIAGIAILDELDHYIKEVLRPTCYVRYMDDFILLHKDNGYLSHCMEAIGEKLRDVQLSFNVKKTHVHHISRNITFLGFRFVVKDTGKVLMILLPKNIKERRVMLKKLTRKWLQGKLTFTQLQKSYEGWRAHAMKGDNRKAVYTMDAYFKALVQYHTEEIVA
mgnify:CR=1 FL=1|jgi:RNA-directed DNA polymerase